MSIITDYKFAKRKEKRDQTNDTINNLLNAVQVGKGIWDTVQESNKYKPGSDYMNAQELGSKTWPMDVQNAKAKLDEAKAAGDQTRILALQKYIADRTSELSHYEQPQMNYRAQLAAGDQKTEKQSRMAAAIREAFGLAQTNPSWFLNDPSDPSGNSKMPNPETIDKLRENLLLAVGMYNPTKEDIAAVTPYLNSLLSSKEGGSTVPQDAAKGPKSSFNPPDIKDVKPKVELSQITGLAKSLSEVRKKVTKGSQEALTLDYLQGQLPRMGNAKGGPDYSSDPVGWVKKAYEFINQLQGIVGTRQGATGRIPRP
jgi:uncharacterized membrane protein